MITADRLDELATYRPDDDTPDDAKVRIPVGDLRDLVKLIPVVRAVIRMANEPVGLDGENHAEKDLYATLETVVSE